MEEVLKQTLNKIQEVVEVIGRIQSNQARQTQALEFLTKRTDVLAEGLRRVEAENLKLKELLNVEDDEILARVRHANIAAGYDSVVADFINRGGDGLI
jgi:septation ring formation regulator EzrA